MLVFLIINLPIVIWLTLVTVVFVPEEKINISEVSPTSLEGVQLPAVLKLLLTAPVHVYEVCVYEVSVMISTARIVNKSFIMFGLNKLIFQ